MHLRDIRGALTRAYFAFDGRSLALGRVVLATVLLVDLWRRVPWIRDLYSNDGLLPNHTVLWQPLQPRVFSVFLMASRPEEAAVGFAIAFVCFFGLLIGWHTRLFQILSFVMSTSLHTRILFAENGGAVALGALLFWTAFLPLGRRFSIDALLADLRARRAETSDDLKDWHPAPDRRPFVSLAVLALLLQLALIYGFNYVHKSGFTWRNGTAVHYVLEQERIVTWLGVWGRHHFPFAVTKALTYGTLVIEAIAPALILSPFFRPTTRALAIVLLAGLHGSIALLVNLGIFSAAMIAYYPFLIDAAHWDGLARRWPKRPRQILVFYDASCGVCFLAVRVLARLDVGRRLRWISNRDAVDLPPDVAPALLDQTVLVVDDAGRRWTRSDALSRVFAALPLGFLWAWGLRLPGVRTLAGAAYDVLARNRTSLSVSLGLAACPAAGAITPSDRPAGEASRDDALAPWRVELRRLLPLLREFGVAFAIVVGAADASVANSAMPPALRWERRPEWMAATVMYTHVQEGWGMFAPEAPIYDEMVYVDAITRDGRHVDPFNEVGSRVHDLPVADIPVRLGNDSFFCDYTLRIPGSGAYHQALLEWIQRYPERTGEPRDALVSFDVFKLEHTPPPPGATEPSNVRRTSFLHWPK